ncbi:hypothetical protein J437_LFUL018395 [Ladona fulva]|uniref:Uncharacterized protein n=1 Tax=Ladona fulva TaxID=123851 RepID=A0A8K0PAP4_LADFU|nr:hypothetical protein J437_LFUL018395 [Ladona fulva]
MQPLDKVFFKPLKDYLSQMSDNWLLNYPGRFSNRPTNACVSQSTSQCDIPPTDTNIIASTSDDIVGLIEQMSTEQNVADVTDQLESSFNRPKRNEKNGKELINAVITPVRERTVKK